MRLKSSAKDFSININGASWKFIDSLVAKDIPQLNFKKYVYDPCQIELTELENDFAQFLEENSSDMLWWYKNSNQTHQNEIFIQYLNIKISPDFMVMMEDGFLGLFILDQNQRNLKDIAKILQNFIKIYNSKHKLFGGIITKCNDSFWISDSSEYEELIDDGIIQENDERKWYKLKTYINNLNCE
ncbi:MAG: Unknown protein [uncultured Campylobacterales bacterium]|uniref:Uncharacterized protein n=1 Tax=uncultured Campylobacterales bacterium TaxID=352960 RepID=A0A6S6SN58_9BACT|nr:MAG: Unknown protein [uncultured Campylobacterales bacterium]